MDVAPFFFVPINLVLVLVLVLVSFFLPLSTYPLYKCGSRCDATVAGVALMRRCATEGRVPRSYLSVCVDVSVGMCGCAICARSPRAMQHRCEHVVVAWCQASNSCACRCG
jgi:hypothetical protein